MAKSNNLTDFLTDVADAIRAKKGTTDKINPQDFSSEIAELEVVDAKTAIMMNGMTFGALASGSLSYNVDTSRMTDMSEMFAGAVQLRTVPYMDTSNVTNMYRMFYQCNIITFSQLDTSKVTNMSYMFYNGGTYFTTCPILDTSKVKKMECMFYSCDNLSAIPQLDFSSVTSMTNMVYSCASLRFMVIDQLGKSSLTTYDFSGATNWGTGSDENRQSLIDSLITNSYDRASNGMTIATITLSSTTKALLTDDEIAQITAKGFTIA